MISLLVGELGVDEGRAKGGAGLLFTLAPMKEGGLGFQKIKDTVPDVDEIASRIRLKSKQAFRMKSEFEHQETGFWMCYSNVGRLA